MAVVTLADVKSHLNIGDDDDNDELTACIGRGEALIAQRVGPLEATSRTERVVPVGTRLRLPGAPVVSLTSVTPADGTALTLSDLHLDDEAGVVTYNSGLAFTARYYDVVYQAGRESCPADLVLAVLETIRHLWETQRGPTRRPGSDVGDRTANTVPGAAYSLPFRVQELIAPHEQPGFG